MAVKTANVNLRMKADIKEQAEIILANLGIPRSVAIDMFYRQIIAHNGIPFSLTLPNRVLARDEMTNEQFNKFMETGLKQAKQDESVEVDEGFADLGV
ncbi:type II toxin-antitoxin system RelB/DinJ family antitoxin [Anaerovibrio sp. RM50]|uniref:type II toxin-antitoxin system RelB/DinJ family antitoxin n=1 Tax=Anaerovibrio sp. RM50 TaxID=1200557 RepID=UPI0004868D7F|nr:type II toxin-antitoxin system RelB/DinJ family antitoxin [Anaerovibrio sp. RM50]